MVVDHDTIFSTLIVQVWEYHMCEIQVWEVKVWVEKVNKVGCLSHKDYCNTV